MIPLVSQLSNSLLVSPLFLPTLLLLKILLDIFAQTDHKAVATLGFRDKFTFHVQDGEWVYARLFVTDCQLAICV